MQKYFSTFYLCLEDVLFSTKQVIIAENNKRN